MDFLKSVTNTVSGILPGNKKNNVVAVAENSNGDVAVVATNAPANSSMMGGKRRRRGGKRKTHRKRKATHRKRKASRRNNMRRNTRRNRRNNY
jgi:hypothetical protein